MNNEISWFWLTIGLLLAAAVAYECITKWLEHRKERQEAKRKEAEHLVLRKRRKDYVSSRRLYYAMYQFANVKRMPTIEEEEEERKFQKMLADMRNAPPRVYSDSDLVNLQKNALAFPGSSSAHSNACAYTPPTKF